MTTEPPFVIDEPPPTEEPLTGAVPAATWSDYAQLGLMLAPFAARIFSPAIRRAGASVESALGASPRVQVPLEPMEKFSKRSGPSQILRGIGDTIVGGIVGARNLDPRRAVTYAGELADVVPPGAIASAITDRPRRTEADRTEDIREALRTRLDALPKLDEHRLSKILGEEIEAARKRRQKQSPFDRT